MRRAGGRRTRARLASLSRLAALALVTWGSGAGADPEPKESTESSAWGGSRSLLQHFGVEVSRGLLRAGAETADPVAGRVEILRGIDRAVGQGTPEGIAALVQLVREAHGLGRGDATVVLAVTRALAPFAAQRPVSRALGELVLYDPGLHVAGRAVSLDELSAVVRVRDEARQRRVELARDTAALALAEARDETTTELLLMAARHAGPGRSAATRALVAFPPAAGSLPTVMTPEAIAVAVALGDLRTRDAVLEASGSVDRSTRVAALRGVGALGDVRAIPVAEAASEDSDPLVRQAATGALVDLGAGSAARAVRRLIEGDATALSGIELSPRVSGDEVVGALAARMRVSADLPLRRAAVVALGRQDARALPVLADLLTDPTLAGDAAEAIARAEAKGAWDFISRALLSPPLRRLGARMAALRGRVRREDKVPRGVLGALADLARSADRTDRGTAAAALFLLGARDPSAALDDPDVGVRRAAAMASEPTDPAQAAALARRLARESDPLTRTLLMRGLVTSDGEGLTTTVLLDRVRRGGIDAPIATLALARRGGGGGDDALRDAIDEAIDSPDPLLRAHAARGLSRSSDPSAIGRLAAAYEAEVDPGARRAIIAALAARIADEDVPLRAHALYRASRFDPEPSVRAIASRARSGLPVPELPSGSEVVWLRVMTADGKPPPPPVVRGVVLRADGLALPVVFDDDGYVLVPAPIGPSRLVLAPRLPPPYDAVHHGEGSDSQD